MPAPDNSQRVLAPLDGFSWEGQDFEFADGVWIKHFGSPPELGGMEKRLAGFEWDSVRGARHWLVHEYNPEGTLSTVEIGNLVLLSLWIVRPTRTCIKHRFELAANGLALKQARLLDRFLWIPDWVEFDFHEADLHAASRLYPVLSEMCRVRGRLNNALLLTIGGCWASLWQAALIDYAAAAETILTWSSEPGSTKRLAKTFACLTETEKSRTDAAFREFEAVYEIRSDIVHGRTHKIAPADRLRELNRFATILRRLWQRVCESASLVADLEASDYQRRAHFEVLEQGYTPPQRT